MTGEELRAYRKRLGMSQKELGQLIARSLGRSEPSTIGRIGKWENDREPISAEVSAFLETLASDGATFTLEDTPLNGDVGGGEGGWKLKEDSAPGLGKPAAVLAIGSSYSSLCEQFFELVATAVGMVGAAIGSDAMMKDGEIILQDKQALGAAYGKLAETNEVFRNMLQATDKQGAYLAVALTTGATVGRIWRNHSYTHPVDAEGVLHVVPGTPGASDAFA